MTQPNIESQACRAISQHIVGSVQRLLAVKGVDQVTDDKVLADIAIMIGVPSVELTPEDVRAVIMVELYGRSGLGFRVEMVDADNSYVFLK